jgi:hypothetical protein
VFSLILTYTREQVLIGDIHKQRCYAKNIKVGEPIYWDTQLFPCKVTSVTRFESEQDGIELEIEGV